MPVLQIRLFGKLCLAHARQPSPGFETSPRRVQELFSYLLLHRAQPLSRELLATLFWGDSPTAQARKGLRQTLWQLQQALEGHSGPDAQRLLHADAEWIQLNPHGDFWLDVAQFEQAFALAHGIPGSELDLPVVSALQAAVDLYRGDLLEGWYHDWCLYERERLQHAYLTMLDKLAQHSEACGAYETGIAYAMQILRYECARECTHRQLMRLYLRAGDRAAALRQYARCVAALDEELGVEPAANTRALYGQIQADRLDQVDTHAPPARPAAITTPPLSALLAYLRQFAATLDALQCDVQDKIQALEHYDNQRESA